MTRKLQHIDFTDNQISDASILNSFAPLMLTEVKPKLISVILTKNLITDLGAEAIFTSFIQLKTITHVSLADNRITDEFLVWLHKFLKDSRVEHNHTSLTSIDLSNNAFTKSL